MDKETIRTVALDKYNDSEFRIPNAYCFIEGAEWLQSLPLTERLTKEEKGKIKDLYKESKQNYQIASNIDKQAAYYAQGKIDAIELVFGKELLTDNNEE